MAPKGFNTWDFQFVGK